MIFPEPLLISFDEWASRLISEYAPSFLPQPFWPWQDWAKAILKDSQFASLGAPSPDQFQNWYDWASVLYKLSLSIDSST